MRKLWMIILLLCLTALPVRAEMTRVVDVEVWSDDTVAIAEDDSGERWVYILIPDGQDGYTVRRSGPWPEDTVFCGVWSEGRIEVMWGGNRIAWYERQPDGEWYLSGLQDYSADTWYVDAWCGLYEDGTGRFIVGNTAVPLTDGPAGDVLFDLLETPDRTGWAVVNAPGSAAPLYTEPDEASTMQGSFFTGAPVRVLEEGTAWCRVAIGAEDAMMGWMPADSLAVGEGVAAVAAEFPRFSLSEETWEYMPPMGPYIAIGEKGGQLILLVELERLMLVPPCAAN